MFVEYFYQQKYTFDSLGDLYPNQILNWFFMLPNVCSKNKLINDVKFSSEVSLMPKLGCKSLRHLFA